MVAHCEIFAVKSEVLKTFCSCLKFRWLSFHSGYDFGYLLRFYFSMINFFHELIYLFILDISSGRNFI